MVMLDNEVLPILLLSFQPECDCKTLDLWAAYPCTYLVAPRLR